MDSYNAVVHSFFVPGRIGWSFSSMTMQTSSMRRTCSSSYWAALKTSSVEMEDAEGWAVLSVVVLDIVVVEEGIVLWGRRQTKSEVLVKIFTNNSYTYLREICPTQIFVIADIIIVASGSTGRMNEGYSRQPKLGSKLTVFQEPCFSLSSLSLCCHITSLPPPETLHPELAPGRTRVNPLVVKSRQPWSRFDFFTSSSV